MLYSASKLHLTLLIASEQARGWEKKPYDSLQGSAFEDWSLVIGILGICQRIEGLRVLLDLPHMQ